MDFRYHHFVLESTAASCQFVGGACDHAKRIGQGSGDTERDVLQNEPAFQRYLARKVRRIQGQVNGVYQVLASSNLSEWEVRLNTFILIVFSGSETRALAPLTYFNESLAFLDALILDSSLSL